MLRRFACCAVLVFLAACDKGQPTQAQPKPKPSQADEASAEQAKPAHNEKATAPGRGFTVVDAEPGDAIADVLRTHASKARAKGEDFYVELGATWCPPCNKLAESLDHPLIKEAFKGVYILRLDIDKWGKELAPVGLSNTTIPVFYAVDGEGVPGRALTGAAWEEDTPENMAGALGAFFAKK